MATNEDEFQDILIETLLEDEYDEGDVRECIKNITTFEGEMMLTRNRGLVVKLEDGSEFELTIVQRK